jgi:large subunit ribosomal protein L9
MELILIKNVDNLGYKDELVTVKPGYGRNFLIPQGYAKLATPSAIKAHNETLKQRSHKEAKIKEEAAQLAAKLEGVTIKIAAKASESGRIFGSINTIQLAEALKEQGIEIDRRSLKIKDEPIRDAGTYTAEANLHKEVKQAFQFEVVGE